MTQYENEEYLTPDEASAELGVKPRTLDRYATGKKRLLTKYKQGITGRVMYKRSEIEELKRLRSQITPEDQ